jgi:hypothetical protein
MTPLPLGLWSYSPPHPKGYYSRVDMAGGEGLPEMVRVWIVAVEIEEVV